MPNIQSSTPGRKVTHPKVFGLSPGTSAQRETTSIVAGKSMAAKARPGKSGTERIFLRLMASATNKRPNKAADAPDDATRKSVHSFMVLALRS